MSVPKRIATLASVNRGGLKDTPESAERTTPDWLFQSLDKIFKFDLDAAATAANAKCANYFTKERDALAQSWTSYGKSIFLNPPYSRGQLVHWLNKSVLEATSGACVVAILSGDFGTQWFDICWREASVLFFMRGRIKFNGISTGAKFPTVIAVFDSQVWLPDSYAAEQLKQIGKGGQLLIRVRTKESWSIG